jgi:hypothetical protein
MAVGAPGNQGRWLWRTVRGLRLDRNPLRRGTDRVEACLLAGLFTAGAAMTPFAVHQVGRAAYLAGEHARQEQLASRHHVQAVLTQSAAMIGGYALAAQVPGHASWTAANGVPRSGQIPVRPGTPSGTAVPVWIDTSGYLVSPPLPQSEVASDADAAAVGAVVGLAIGCAAGAAGIRQLFNRRRMAAWEADWLVTAPAWKRQRW